MILWRLVVIGALLFWPLGVASAQTDTPPPPTPTSTPFPMPEGPSTPTPTVTPTPTPDWYALYLGTCEGEHYKDNSSFTSSNHEFACNLSVPVNDDVVYAYIINFTNPPETGQRWGWYNGDTGSTFIGNFPDLHEDNSLWEAGQQLIYLQGVSGAFLDWAVGHYSFDFTHAIPSSDFAHANFEYTYDFRLGYRCGTFSICDADWSFDVYVVRFGIEPVDPPLVNCDRQTVAMVAYDGGVINYVIYPYHWTDLQVLVVEDTWFVSDDASAFCVAGLACEIPFSNGTEFICESYSGGGCSASYWSAVPYFCTEEGAAGIGELEPVVPFGVSFGLVGSECIYYSFDEFDLSEFILSPWVTTFETVVPAWGWQAGSWEICLGLYSFDELYIGTTDFVPFVEIMLTMLSLAIVGFFVRR